MGTEMQRAHRHGRRRPCHFTVASVNVNHPTSTNQQDAFPANQQQGATNPNPSPSSNTHPSHASRQGGQCQDMLGGGINAAAQLLASFQASAPSPFRLPSQPDRPGSSSPPSGLQGLSTAPLASLPSPLHWASPPWLRQDKPEGNTKNAIRHTHAPDESAPLLIGLEVTNGRKRTYHQRGHDGWDMVEAAHTARGRLTNLLKSYMLPQGFPESVAPQYASYMAWRGIQYFFGGAISVYTTKSLLGALGVTGKFSGEASAAINWVIKDGAGRLGRLLFARWGRELDCELKQFRLAGDLLMEGGAALELATIWAPKAFLPLACTANLAKNLAAVAASSTRAPIYRTFALQNNLADITAKGESVANLADILGTVAGILLSRAALPLVPTFCFLSAGYLVASRREVDSVELPYLNRARLGYVGRAFLSTGVLPGVAEANHGEPLLPGQGFNYGRIVLGSSLEAACHGPSDLKAALASSHHNHKYLLSYREDHNKVHVLLKEGATSQDCLRAVFAAHLFLYTLDGLSLSGSLPGCPHMGPVPSLPDTPWRAALAQTCKLTDVLYPEFIKQAEKQGWNLNQTMLNPKETRLLSVTTPL